jgi:SAM-dependent methyltransferase
VLGQKDTVLEQTNLKKRSSLTSFPNEEKAQAMLGRAKLAMDWINKDDLLLDVGCSDGTFVSGAHYKCQRAVGVDVDRENLKKAQESCADAEFYYGSADDLPFDNAMFSVVTMLDVLEHVPDPEGSLKEVDRVLRPGGRFIISVPHRGTFGFVDAQKSIMFAVGRKLLLGKGDPILEHRHFLTDEIASMVGPGYEMKRVHMGGYLVFPLCGYALMFTDNLNIPAISNTFRRLEERDFQHDYGEKSWHLMVEFSKKS